MFLDGGVTLFPGGFFAWMSSGLPVTAATFRATDLLFAKVSSKHQIHGESIGSLKI